MKFHVITPLARFENFSLLVDMLKPLNITWHVIIDEGAEYPKLKYDCPWLYFYVCPNKGVQFFERCNYAINWFLETQHIEEDDVYCILNDDDAYEPDFFDKLGRVFEDSTVNVTICSMERGHNIPASAVGCRAHPPTKLWAAVENIRVGAVGIEQIAIRGKLIKNTKIPLTNDGDGYYIVSIVKMCGAILVSDANIWFNYFEPGRWNK